MDRGGQDKYNETPMAVTRKPNKQHADPYQLETQTSGDTHDSLLVGTVHELAGQSVFFTRTTNNRIQLISPPRPLLRAFLPRSD
jgi:hypothetical protein